MARDARGTLRSRRLFALLLLALGAAVATSCSHLRYYSQAISGGASVLWHRRPIAELLASETLGEEQRRRLELVLAIRRFAVEELGLPDNRSYRSFVDLERDYAVWNVYAAPRLSVEPRLWCFPIVGCVIYRGYFSEEGARRYAARLARDDYDVAVGGVIAYSTLGWFADPVLDTFLFLPDAELAGLLFHELAHQRVFARGDTVFNESFATVVELEGVRRWLEAAGRVPEIERFLAARQRESELVEAVLDYRGRLASVFAEDRPEDWKLERKAELLSELERVLRARREANGSEDTYAGWLDGGLNNAHLAQVSAYHELVPALERLLEESKGALPVFYDRVAALARRSSEERVQALGAGVP